MMHDLESESKAKPEQFVPQHFVRSWRLSHREEVRARVDAVKIKVPVQVVKLKTISRREISTVISIMV